MLSFILEVNETLIVDYLIERGLLVSSTSFCSDWAGTRNKNTANDTAALDVCILLTSLRIRLFFLLTQHHIFVMERFLKCVVVRGGGIFLQIIEKMGGKGKNGGKEMEGLGWGVH